MSDEFGGIPLEDEFGGIAVDSGKPELTPEASEAFDVMARTARMAGMQALGVPSPEALIGLAMTQQPRQVFEPVAGEQPVQRLFDPFKLGRWRWLRLLRQRQPYQCLW